MSKKQYLKFFYATVIIILSLYLLYVLRLIVFPFLIGYLFHYALRPCVNLLGRHGVKHVTAVCIVFFLFFGILCFFLHLFIPAVSSEFSSIQDNLPSYKQAIVDKVAVIGNSLLGGLTVLISSESGSTDLRVFLTDYVNGYLSTLGKNMPSIIIGLLPLVFYIIIVPFATFFFLLDEYRIKTLLIQSVPNRYFETTLNLFYTLNRQFSFLIRGMMISTILMSIIISIQLWFIGLDYPLLLGVFSGFANLIPYAGPIVGVISAFIVAIMTDAPNYMYFSIIIVFIIANIIDNVFIQPLVIAKAANLHPLIVIFLVLLGSKYGGILGMFFAVPIASLLQVVFKIVYREIKRPERPDFSFYRDTIGAS